MPLLRHAFGEHDGRRRVRAHDEVRKLPSAAVALRTLLPNYLFIFFRASVGCFCLIIPALFCFVALQFPRGRYRLFQPSKAGMKLSYGTSLW